MSEFLLPDLGEGLAEAEIVEWHVGAGDHVVTGQPLLSVETDKSIVEIPSPRGGTIAACHGEPGDLVAVGAALVTYADDSASADGGTVVGRLPEGEASQTAQAQAPASRAPGSPAPGSPAPGSAAPASQAVQPQAVPATPEAQDVPATPEAPATPEVPATQAVRATAAVRAAPAVRAAAQRLGVDLAGLVGSGPGGAITRADVAAAAESTSLPPAEPLRGVRRAMAANMARAHREVVPATVHDVADVGDWPADADPTLRLLRAIGAAVAAAPVCNAAFLGPDRGLRYQADVHVGVAVETDDGLFVPVLRNVARRSAQDLRAGLDRMRADVADRSIPPEELAGATITLSNFGMHGGMFGHLVVLPPQVAIVGAGRMHDAVVARDGVPVVRRVLPLSLTIDHRVVTGVESLRFLRALIDELQAAG